MKDMVLHFDAWQGAAANLEQPSDPPRRTQTVAARGQVAHSVALLV